MTDLLSSHAYRIGEAEARRYAQTERDRYQARSHAAEADLAQERAWLEAVKAQRDALLAENAALRAALTDHERRLAAVQRLTGIPTAVLPRRQASGPAAVGSAADAVYQAEFADLPPRAGYALIRAGLDSRAAVAAVDLSQYAGIGPTLEQTIRLAIPYQGNPARNWEETSCTS